MNISCVYWNYWRNLRRKVDTSAWHPLLTIVFNVSNESYSTNAELAEKFPFCKDFWSNYFFYNSTFPKFSPLKLCIRKNFFTSYMFYWLTVFEFEELLVEFHQKLLTKQILNLLFILYGKGQFTMDSCTSVFCFLSINRCDDNVIKLHVDLLIGLTVAKSKSPLWSSLKAIFFILLKTAMYCIYLLNYEIVINLSSHLLFSLIHASLLNFSQLIATFVITFVLSSILKFFPKISFFKIRIYSIWWVNSWGKRRNKNRWIVEFWKTILI